MKKTLSMLLFGGMLFIPALAAATPLQVHHGEVVVGVDILGRVIVSLDSDGDGLANVQFLYTAAARLQPYWQERLQNAKVSVTEGSLSVRTSPPSFILSVATFDTEPQAVPQPPMAEVFEDFLGVELAQFDMAHPEPSMSLDSLDLSDLSTLPEWMQYDFHDPESRSCNISACDTSDPTYCSIICLPKSIFCPWQSTAHCAGSNSFACCGCVFLYPDFQSFSFARCRGCGPGGAPPF